MKTIAILKNAVQGYAWGSYSAIPELLGDPPPYERPQAELWMGAHPKAPSMVLEGNCLRPLPEAINEAPEDMFGTEAARKFNDQLPFLFKVLAALQPLSIQAHPNKLQAKDGFERENRLGIPLDSPHRNYKDPNHKPECLCALSRFWALSGFRPIPDMISLSEKIGGKLLLRHVHHLRVHPDADGLRNFFLSLMSMDSEQQQKVIAEVVDAAERYFGDGEPFQWIVRLRDAYPRDIGIMAPLFMNLICLEPGEAIFLPAGQLHSYLEGIGVEVMANSDNVLRGGLTPKRIDIPELLQTITFDPAGVQILSPQTLMTCEAVYYTETDEFMLCVVRVGGEKSYVSSEKRSVEIMLCTDGEAVIADRGSGETLPLCKGTAVIIPAAVKQYRITGEAVIYKAAVPLG